MLFVEAFGSKEGQERYESKYDLNGNGEIGIGDFLIFVDSFGKEVAPSSGQTVNNDNEEPSAPVPSHVMVEEDDSKLIVRWDAVLDEEGKPPVTGYEVGHRERPDPFDPPRENSNEWKGIQRVSSQLDSLIITGLLNGQAYLVSVRTLVDGGMSAWSSPVLGIPVIPAAGPVFPGGGGSGGGSTSQPPPLPPPPPPPPPPLGPNQAPTFNDGANTSRSVAENTASNQNIQHPVSATDDDRDRLIYRLSGTDADFFTLNASNGQLRTQSGVTYDHEALKNSYDVTITADDNRGGEATIDVTIYVGDVNEPPERPARPQVTPASSTSLTVTWTEPINTGPDIYDYDVQYRTGSGSFIPHPHNNTSITTTITNLDVNTRYEVQVRATNDEDTGEWSSSGFGTTSANQPPVFDELAPTRSLAENTTGTQNIGTPVRVTDPEGSTVSYRLTGGDTDQFTIDANNGQLRTQTGVDYNYEVKNRYSVTVEAQDDQGGRATITVPIGVTDDDNEQPGRPDRPSVTASTLNSLSIQWTEPVNTGPNINDYDVQYKESGGTFDDWPHTSTGRSTTITSLTANTLYEVQVLARSPEGQSQWSESVTVTTVANQAPTFTEGTRTTRSIAENTTGTHNIGNPITATDGDGGTLTYHLKGEDQASFALDGNQLQTLPGVTYDYEEQNRYEVIVRVEDGQGGSKTIEVTINLTDVQEPPEDPTAPSVSAASSTSLTATWDEPTNTGPDIDDYDVQYREGDSGNFTTYAHNSADRTATITGRTPGTSYEVQVRAHNAEGWSGWSDSGEGSTSANELPVFTDESSATRSFDENTTGVHNIGDPISATDPENTTLTYSLEGQDRDAFTFDTRSGQLRTKSGQTYDYETQSSYSVDVKATDGHSGERTIPVFIDLNDVNEAPTFISDATFEAEENNQFAGLVDAEDVDSGDGITGYTITGGADRDLLEINSGGVLTFTDAPNFENPTDSGRNNTYIVVVTATGGTGGRALTAAQTITVTVTDENEPPHFTSDDAFTVQENIQIVGRMVAEDVDNADQITGYTITGGSDQNEFEITNTNQLHFKDDPDFERPTDVGGNNEYVVVVTATGGTGTRKLTATQTITVVVDDADEPPGQPPAPMISIADTRSSLLVSPGRRPLANTGPEITAWEIQYRVKDSGDFISYDPDPEPDWTEPDWEVAIPGLNRNTTYKVQVRAKNDEGLSEWSPSAEIEVPNQSVVVASSIGDVTLPVGGAVEVVSVDDSFDGPDDVVLKFTASSSNTSAATVQVRGAEVLVDPQAAGTATITITASDPWGANASTTFSADIRRPTLAAPSLSITGNLIAFEFTEDFTADETRAYEFRVRQKDPIGNWATGCYTETNDESSSKTITVTVQKLVSDFFEPGNTYEADYAYLGANCGSVVGVRSETAEATVPGTASFDIDVVFVGSVSSEYRSLVESAVERWEQVIACDTPARTLTSNTRDVLNGLYPGTTAPEVVDDLLVYVRIGPPSFFGGNRAYAGVLGWRVPSYLPIISTITLQLDPDELSDQQLIAVILHEFGHTLGFGTMWEDHYLLQNPSLDENGDPIVPAPDTHFSGANAIAAFNDAGGSSYTGAKVPVENLTSRSQDSHWRESVLGNELMTPTTVPDASAGITTYPLSAITIQSLADLGYRVDVTQADAYTLPSTSSTTGVRAAEGLSIPINCTIITHPDAGPDKPEPIILNLKPAGN